MREKQCNGDYSNTTLMQNKIKQMKGRKVKERRKEQKKGRKEQKKGRKKEEKNNNGLSYYVNPFIS